MKQIRKVIALCLAVVISVGKRPESDCQSEKQQSDGEKEDNLFFFQPKYCFRFQKRQDICKEKGDGKNQGSGCQRKKESKRMVKDKGCQ